MVKNEYKVQVLFVCFFFNPTSFYSSFFFFFFFKKKLSFDLSMNYVVLFYATAKLSGRMKYLQ